MADEKDILGISGQLDITDIYGSIDKLYSMIGQIEGISQGMAQKVEAAYQAVGKATEKELAQKSKEALDTFSQALGEAKNVTERNVQTIEKNIGKLQQDLAKVFEEMKDVPMDSAKYREMEATIAGLNSQIANQEQLLARTKQQAADYASAFDKVSSIGMGSIDGAAGIQSAKIAADEAVQSFVQAGESVIALKEELANMDGKSIDEIRAKTDEYKNATVSAADSVSIAYQKQQQYVDMLEERVSALYERLTDPNTDASELEEVRDEYARLAVEFGEANRKLIDLGEAMEAVKNEGLRADDIKETANAFGELNEKLNEKQKVDATTQSYEDLKKKLKDTGKTAGDTGEKLRDEAKDTASEVKKQNADMEQSLEKLTQKIAGVFAAYSVTEFGRKIMETRGQFQQLEVAFTTMLGSADRANELMEQLTKTAAITPFDLQGVTNGAKQLLAYGVAAEEVNDTLIHLGDIAAGLSLPLNDLVFLYGTTMTQGRMFTQDLRQFMGRGIPIAEELAKQFGVTKDKVGELVSAGKVGADEFKKAIMAMSSEGGKFAGLMEAQSKTITGQISNIEDAIDSMFNDMGKQSEGIINGTLSAVSSLVENYERVGKILLALVSTYGAYKAAIIAVNAVKAIEKNYATMTTAAKATETAATAATTGAKVAETAATTSLSAAELIHHGRIMLVQKAQALLNATMLANPYVLVTTLIVGVVAALWSMKSAQEKVKDALDDYNASKDEAIAKEDEHKRKIEELMGVAEDESAATGTREAALKKLLLSYPSIFKKYEQEANLLSKIRDIKREIAELDGKTSLRNPVNERRSLDADIKKLEDSLNARKTGNRGKYTDSFIGTSTQELQTRLRALRQQRETVQKQIDKNERQTYLTNLTGVSNDDLRAQINQRNQLLAQMTVSGKKYGKTTIGGVTGVFSREELEAQLSAFKQEQARRKQLAEDATKNFAQEHQKQLSEAQKALRDFQKLNDPKLRAKTTMEIGGVKVSEFNDEQFKKELAKRQQAVNEAKKQVDADKKAASGGVSTSKEESAAERQAKKEDDLAKLRRRQQLEQSQQAVAAQRAQEEAVIAEMAKGAQREQRQAELDHQKRLDEIERQRQQMLEKNIEVAAAEYEKNRTKGSQGFYAQGLDKKVSLTDDQQKEIDARLKLEALTYKRMQEDLADGLIQSHQSYVDRKLAIDKKYRDDVAAIDAAIADAEARGDTERIEALRRSRIEAARQRAESQASLSLDELKKTPEYVRAFEDLGNTSSETLNFLIGEFERAKEAAAHSLDPEHLREYTNTLQQMYDELNARNPFKSFAESAKELKKAQDEVREAQERLNLVKGGAMLIKSITYDEKTKKFNVENWDEEKATRALAAAKDKEAQAYNRVLKAVGACSQQIMQFGSMLEQLGNSIGGSFGGALGAVGGIANSLGGVIGSIQNINTSATGLSAVLQKVNAIGTTVSAMIDLNMKLNSILPDSHSLYEHYAAKQREINEMQQRIMELQIDQLEDRLNKEHWIYSNGLTNLKKGAELNKKYLAAYGKVATQPQEIYQNAGSGFSSWAPAIFGAIVGIIGGVLTFGAGSGIGAALGATIGSAIGGTAIGAALGSTVIAAIGTAIFAGAGAAFANAVRAGIDTLTYDSGQTAAINNMRVQTRHRTFFRSEKTQDLQSWVKENWGEDLFEDVKGVSLVDPEVARKILGEGGPTLVGETRETLEKLLEYSEKAHEFLDEIHEYVSNAFSPLVDNLTDALWDWLKNGTDVMDSFRKYAGDTFQSIAKDAMKAIATQLIFEPFQEQLEDLTIAFSTGQMDETAYMLGVSAFATQAQEAIEKYLPSLESAMQTIQTAFDNAGIDIVGGTGGAEDKSATYNSLEKWTYDQADELINRATALQIIDEHQYEILSQSLDMAYSTMQGVESIRVTVSDILDGIQTTIDLHETTNARLERIVQNTAPIAEIRDLVKKLYNER